MSTDFCVNCGYSVVDEVVRRYEEGDAEFFEAEADDAALMLKRIYAACPELIPDEYQEQPSVVDAINAGFGNR